MNYKSNFDPSRDIWLPNQMGIQLNHIDEIISYIKKLDTEKTNSFMLSKK